MNEETQQQQQEKNQKKVQEQPNKETVITPNQTGEIVQREVTSPKTEEEVVSEVQEPAKKDEQVVEVSSEMGQNVGNVEKESEKDKNADDISPTEGDESGSPDEVQSEEEVVVEEQQQEEEEKKDKESEETTEKQQQEEEEKKEVDIEQLQKELNELKAEKEEEARVKELVEVAQKVEVEYDRVVNGINEALRETLEQYQIPTDKTIKELEAEDPAKAKIARDLITQAKQVLDYNTQQLTNAYKAKEQDVIFTKAERLFNKYEMSNEQAQVAADTFISILQASGLQDLNEDLAAKVELSVAQARFKIPSTAEKVPNTTLEVEVTPSGPQDVSNVQAEATPEPEKTAKTKPKEETKKEVKEEANNPQDEPVIKRGIAKESPKNKVDLDGYKEGVAGESTAAANKAVDTSNVLHKLASLPSRERQLFLKENFALVNKAMKETVIKSKGFTV